MPARGCKAGQHLCGDCGFAVFGPDIGPAHGQLTVAIDINENPGMGFLVVGETTVKDRLQCGKFGLAVLVQGFASRQFGQFVIAGGLFLGQFALDRIDFVQLLGDFIRDKIVLAGLRPFPAMAEHFRVHIQLFGKEAVQQVGAGNKGIAAEQIACDLPACAFIGIQPDIDRAAVIGADRFGLQKLFEAGHGIIFTAHPVQNVKRKGLVLGDGEAFGCTKGDFTGFQGVQHRHGQGGKSKAAIDVLFGDGEYAGDGRDGAAAFSHAAIGADFVGRMQGLAGGILDAGPCAGGGFVGRDSHGNFGQTDCGKVIGLQFDDGAQAATARDDADAPVRVKMPGKVLDQASGLDALGQQGDAFGIHALARVHGRQVKLVQRKILDRGFLDRLLFHGDLPCLRRVFRVIGAPARMGRGEGA